MRQRRVLAPQRSRYNVLVPAVMIAAACTTLVGLGRVEAAAAVMWGLLGVMAAWFGLQGKLGNLACLLIGVAPVVNLLRGALFYSGVQLVFAAVVAWWMFANFRTVAGVMRRCPLAFVFLGMACVYYALSFAMTGEFRSNLRVLELACAAVLVVMLGDKPSLLGQALLGTAISAVLVGLGDYPHLMSFKEIRLGMVQGEEFQLGNPFALGAPLALGMLAIALDRGRWLGLARNPLWRLGLLLPTLILLALSTSRAGWLVAAGGLAIGLYTASRQRLAILSWTIVVAVVGFWLWQTPLASPFRGGWERTFGEDRTFNQASAGRIDQWVIFCHALTDSPGRFVSGYGPGTGPAVQNEFSGRLRNLEMPAGTGKQFHALIMQVGVDFGILGLAPLLAWLLIVGWRCYHGCRASGVFLPLACLLGFVLASLTANTFDTVCGLLLGLSLLATRRQMVSRPNGGPSI